MKFYLEAFYKSLYDFDWLVKQKDQLKKAFVYFSLFMLCVGFIFFIDISIGVPKNLKEIKNDVEKNMPEFTLNVINGKINVEGLEQPFIYEDVDKKGNKFVFVVNTLFEEEKKQIKNYVDDSCDIGAMLTEDKIHFYEGEQKKIEIQSLESIPDFQVNKTDIISFLNKWVGLSAYTLLFFIVLFLVFFWSAWKLLYLLFISSIIFIVSNIVNKKWKFKQIYTVGLFALTLPTIISFVLTRFGFHINFFYSAALYFFLTMTLFYGEKKKNENNE